LQGPHPSGYPLHIVPYSVFALL